MSSLTFAEAATASRHALLTGKLTKVLSSLSGNQVLAESSLPVAERGAILLERIIQGSLLVARRSETDGVHASSDGLGAYQKALSAFNLLGGPWDVDETSHLLKLRDQLKQLAQQQPLPEKEVVDLTRFVKSLNKVFCTEVKTFNRDVHPTPGPRGK